MRHPRLRIRSLASLAGLLSGALVCAACATAPGGVRDADDIRITYRDFKTGHEMILVNESNPANAGIYSEQRENANTKVAPDELLNQFIDFAASKGFFDYYEPLAPEQIEASAFRFLAISADGNHYTFTLRPPLSTENQAEIQAFTDVQVELIAVYNSIQQLQFITTESGGAHFEREQERVRREGLGNRSGQGGNR